MCRNVMLLIQFDAQICRTTRHRKTVKTGDIYLGAGGTSRAVVGNLFRELIAYQAEVDCQPFVEPDNRIPRASLAKPDPNPNSEHTD
jgi:hypothetical protein